MHGINRIVIPVDNSEFSEKLVKKGITLAKLLDVKADIITVNDTHHFVSSVILEEKLKKEATEFLEKFKKLADEMGVRSETKLIVGKPSEEIVKYAKEDDLIVIAPHSKTRGIEKYIEKDLCESVIKNAPCSVLVVKIND